jgi:hypothetical protein
MSCLSWQRLALVLPLWGLAAAGTARAQEAPPDAPEGIDDPKLERRLGTRVDLAPSPASDVAAGTPAAAPTSASPTVELVAPGAPEQDGVSPEGEGVIPPRKPRLKLGYRRFTFAQIGTTQATTPAADEAFNVVSLEFYPVSSSIRFGLNTQYGWQEGTFRANGDAFIAGGTSLGFQSPGPVFTPFVEGYAAAGMLQRTKKDLMPASGTGLNSIATAIGQLGIDAGTEVFLAKNFCLSFALGYVHLTNAFARGNALESFSTDTWSFKLGVGL